MPTEDTKTLSRAIKIIDKMTQLTRDNKLKWDRTQWDHEIKTRVDSYTFIVTPYPCESFSVLKDNEILLELAGDNHPDGPSLSVEINHLFDVANTSAKNVLEYVEDLLNKFEAQDSNDG